MADISRLAPLRTTATAVALLIVRGVADPSAVIGGSPCRRSGKLTAGYQLAISHWIL